MGLTMPPSPPTECGGREDGQLKKDIHAIITGKVCRPELKMLCRQENSEFADWACRHCTEFRQPEAISPWTWHLLTLYRLQKAGYPFKANDLSLETWLLLGDVANIIDNMVSSNLKTDTGNHYGEDFGGQSR